MIGPLAFAASVVLANPAGSPPPSCPANPCAVVSRTTAIQSSDGGSASPFIVAKLGRISSWSVTLGTPDKQQIHYFDTHEGGTAQASIGVLRTVGTGNYQLVAESGRVRLQPWFGRTATVNLRKPLRVKPGDTLALVVRTWVPALALNLPSTTIWQASRASSQCNDIAVQTVQDVVGSRAAYACSYPTAEVTFAATERTR